MVHGSRTVRMLLLLVLRISHGLDRIPDHPRHHGCIQELCDGRRQHFVLWRPETLSENVVQKRSLVLFVWGERRRGVLRIYF